MEVNTLTGELVRLFGLIPPELNKLVFSTVYQLADDSAAAKASASAAKADAGEESVADKAMDALQTLELDTETLESISNILKGVHT